MRMHPWEREPRREFVPGVLGIEMLPFVKIIGLLSGRVVDAGTPGATPLMECYVHRGGFIAELHTDLEHYCTDQRLNLTTGDRDYLVDEIRGVAQ
jgi:hypothetical protein